MPTPRLRLATAALCVFLIACDNTPARRDQQARGRTREIQSAGAGPDTAVFVAQQAGHPSNIASSVMQLRVAARDAEVTLENVRGQRSTVAAPGDGVLGIPGSRGASVGSAPIGGIPVPGWDAAVTAPVLAGERYLVEFTPRGVAADSASVSLSSDVRPLMSTRFAIGDSSAATMLFEIVVTSQGLSVSPPIEAVDVVPTCGTSHVIRSAGTADLYARYEVPETGERGDVHLAPRDADARYRSVGLRTATRGGLRITYLGKELAAAAMPEACGSY